MQVVVGGAADGWEYRSEAGIEAKVAISGENSAGSRHAVLREPRRRGLRVRESQNPANDGGPVNIEWFRANQATRQRHVGIRAKHLAEPLP
jgi:hypothetical protein